jgi:hypothetical protein
MLSFLTCCFLLSCTNGVGRPPESGIVGGHCGWCCLYRQGWDGGNGHWIITIGLLQKQSLSSPQ